LTFIAKRDRMHSGTGEIQAKFPYSEFCANKRQAIGTCHKRKNPVCMQTATIEKTDDSFNYGCLLPVKALSEDPLKIVK
jgi:hypothetical protein